MQSSKQSDFERDFERDSTRNAKVLTNPTTLVRAPAPNANAGAALRVLPNTKRRARAASGYTEHGRAAISSAKHALCGVFEAFASVAEHEKACSSGDFGRQVAPRTHMGQTICITKLMRQTRTSTSGHALPDEYTLQSGMARLELRCNSKHIFSRLLHHGHDHTALTLLYVQAYVFTVL